ncbi:hypothetical protein GSI_13568 [Ganoderma sinense ZZ0214-1]|uniref:Chromatin assembly factor 1 subunit A dimerization domain-containing protein n=1 Tax=Ganoderma sinense ZZ0214-1 TaxID=1077348 RepID=A0A2G8RQN5_9APHY|nr:hypothetical protein GSI_13568 [Ganoderma sinense ZZ0214-1]
MTNADLNKVVQDDTPLAEGIDPRGSTCRASHFPPEKPEKPLLVELKNGRLIFKQKWLSFEKMSETMQEIVKFREMLEERLAAKDSPLTTVPDDHKPVFAKLVHESDKTLPALSKHIQQELLPTMDEDEEEDGTPTILPLETVEHTIKSVAKRINYGLDSPVEGGKVPAAWLIWRWEVSDSCHDWLPKNAREKVENRWRERQQLKTDVKTLFDSLPESEQTAILGTKLAPRIPAKAKDLSKSIPGTGVVDLRDGATHCVPPPQTKDTCENAVADPVNGEENQLDSPEKKHAARAKKVVDPEKVAEKAAKEKERLEKKAAKAEREKKVQEAQAKSRSLMANFFGKAKPTATASPSKSTAPKESEFGSPAPTTSRSDFQRTFRPFVLKKEAELAPINWFRERRRRDRQKQRLASRTEGDVIVIDDDDEEKDVEQEDVEMADGQEPEIQNRRDCLNHILARLPPGLNPPRRARQPTGLKTYNSLAVRGLMSQLSEAEVAGDDTEVRRLLALLRDRQAIPAKAFSFHEDARPGYFGTFTRSSREIGPRAPFKQDAVQVDYAYDSGEEWAEEDAGEADDVLDDGGEDDGADEERDSDLDSWLVDDEEVDEPGTPLEDRMSSPGFPDIDLPPLNNSNGKRKAKEEKEKEKGEKSGGGKKRKVVVPLVPFSKGPEWETAVGQCAYEPFKAYRIQLFNDTPFPIDPFKFVSSPIEQQDSGSGTGPSGQSINGFVIPALPPHLVKSNPFSSIPSSSASPSSAGLLSSSAAAATGEKPKRSVLPPKNPFPEAHMPHLLARIDALATSSLLGIVDTVFRELQAHKVKKNAIEAKVREVGEKCKEKKVWVVKADIRAQYGLS